MASMGMKGTKWTIFTTSIEMFAARNYHVVSLRDIAKEVGIRASSIYNHFESKEELLDQILEYFEYHSEKSRPDLEKLLQQADRENPVEMLLSCITRFDPAIKPILNQIITIATNEMHTNKRAEAVICNYFIETPRRYTNAVLNHLTEQGRIKAIDTELMAMLVSSYCFSAALRLDVSRPMGSMEWENGLRKIFQLVEVLPDYEPVETVARSRPKRLAFS